MTDLLFWGDVGWDVYLGPPERVEPGGCALNAAISARAAGATVGVVGALGPDGAALRDLLAQHEIVDLLDARPEPTPRQAIRLAPDGERSLCGYTPGALAQPPSAAVLAAIEQAAFVHLTVFDHTLPWAEEAFARRAGRPLGLDLMDLADVDDAFIARAMREATVVVAGLDRARQAQAIARIETLAREPDAARALLTFGAEGALLIERGQHHSIPAAPVPGGVVDTTGCGDAFAGTFLARCLLGDASGSALKRAAERAASVAARSGAH